MKMPQFKSEQEEAEWYSKNQPSLLRMMKKAGKKGTLQRGTLVKRGLVKK